MLGTQGFPSDCSDISYVGKRSGCCREPGPGQPPAPPAPAFPCAISPGAARPRGALPSPARGQCTGRQPRPRGRRCALTPSPAPVERFPAGEGGGTGGCAFPWVGFGTPSLLPLCLFLLHS